MDAGQITQVADMGGEHSAGGCLVERERERDRGDVSSPSPTAKQRSLRAVYVLNDGLKAVMASSPESGALQCLQRACDAESALLTTVTFGRLDFGETSVLDSFYDAGRWPPVLTLFFIIIILLLLHACESCTVVVQPGRMCAHSCNQYSPGTSQSNSSKCSGLTAAIHFVLCSARLTYC